MTIGTDERLERAWAAMRWVYRNGMRPSQARPQWVSDAFDDAFETYRASLSNEVWETEARARTASSTREA